MPTLQFKTQLKLGLLLISLSLSAMLLWNYWQQSAPSRDRNQLYVELLERSGQLNRDLPKLLDQQTRFERAEVVNYGMRFVYALIAVDRFQHDAMALRRQVEDYLLNSFCHSKD